MKNLTKILCSAAILFATACSKEGPQGPAGTNGTNGNANVTVYNFDTDFVLSPGNIEHVFMLTGLTVSDINNSLILGFFQELGGCSGFWYNAPGLGCNSIYTTKTYVNDLSEFYFKIYDPDGSPYSSINRTFDKFKIFVIPAGTTINLRTGKPLTKMSYEEVCDLLGLEK